MNRPALCDSIHADTESLCFTEFDIKHVFGSIFENLVDTNGAAVCITSFISSIYITSCKFIRCLGTEKNEPNSGAVFINSASHTSIIRCLFKECEGYYSSASIFGLKSGLLDFAQNDITANIGINDIFARSIRCSFWETNYSKNDPDQKIFPIYISDSPTESHIKFYYIEGNSQDTSLIFLSSDTKDDTVIVRNVVARNCFPSDCLIFAWRCHAKVYNLNTFGCVGNIVKSKYEGLIYVYDSSLDKEIIIDTNYAKLENTTVRIGEDFSRRFNMFLYRRCITKQLLRHLFLTKIALMQTIS